MMDGIESRKGETGRMMDENISFLSFILHPSCFYWSIRVGLVIVGIAVWWGIRQIAEDSVSAGDCGASWPVRLVALVVGLGGWFGTQFLIGQKAQGPLQEQEKAGAWLARHDLILQLTEPVNRFLNQHPRWASGLLIVSSFGIDLLGIFLLMESLWGPSIRPFPGLLILFSLRQICQALTALPGPPGMIWRESGFPCLFVTYGVCNDLFFSGHTSIAVYGALELARLGTDWLILAVALAIFEVFSVLILRAHYTMDVFTGAVTALLVAWLANQLAPGFDHWVAGIACWFTWL
jgi:hypothetical protein